MKIFKWIKKELDDYKVLLRSIPSLVVTLFVVSVISMNLLANKELFTLKYLALDCGYTLSWIAFLCMDAICKRFGAKAASKVSILAIAINLLVCTVFKLLSLTPGMWGEYYAFNSIDINTALNNTIGGTWYVVIGSATAMLISSLINSSLNAFIGNRLKNKTFSDFALRSFISTGVAQFADNIIFSTLVSKVFFGWTWIQVILCSLTGMGIELICEVIFSPIGYRISNNWEKDNVGYEYVRRLNEN